MQFAEHNVVVLATGLAADPAARSKARRRLESRSQHWNAREAAEMLALALERKGDYEPTAVLLQDDDERASSVRRRIVQPRRQDSTQDAVEAARAGWGSAQTTWR